jgi:murein DD-endopeptidase MepM/ murein hydrolase activator NlpD
MARRHWTLLVMTDDERQLRQLVIPRQAVQIGIAAALVAFSVLSSLAIGFFVKEGQRLRADRLEGANAVLVAEVEEIRSRYRTLQVSLDELWRRDEHYRLLAGLDPLHEDVRRAGIGGPGTETLQGNDLYRLDPELGRVTFAAAYDLNELVRRARLLSASWREAADTLTATHERLAATPSIMPTRGYISSGFSHSRWHPVLDRPRAHQGLDISAPRGTPIVATAQGRVISVGRQGHYGLMVEIDHGHGVVTRYAHAQRSVVRVGQWVARGEKIGEVGSTGLAVGPHLHYEVLVGGRPMNPLNYILDTDVVPD